MVLIFDLDDTLYEERTYVESGFCSVANWGFEQFGWEADASFRCLVSILETYGRGRVFNRWLAARGVTTKTSVDACIRVYRHHKPLISISGAARMLLPALSSFPLYLVTDGHKVVQANKIEALGIAPVFRRSYITHRYGIRHAKPSLHCFEIIRKRENCRWPEMVYVGDNPAKDFVGLNAVGAHTVRVKTGMHADAIAEPSFEAEHVIPDLHHFQSLIAKF